MDMKLVLDLDLKGLVNYDVPPITLASTGSESQQATLIEVLALGDQTDADGGATDGDIDFVVKKRIFLFDERIQATLALVPEEGG